jgi:serine/threonine-protein kinase RsbW
MSPAWRGDRFEPEHGAEFSIDPPRTIMINAESLVTTREGEAVVELTIPGKPEYVSVARLAIRGVGSRMRFSYDEVEDIRLAVGEACTTAIERVNGAHSSAFEVRVRCLIDPTQLVVEVSDNAPVTPERTDLPDSVLEERSLGGVLVRILMDDVQTTTDPQTGRSMVRMIKYVASVAR